jgi:hypothetical protein
MCTHISELIVVREQNSEVRAIMHEVNGVDGINLMQLALATSLWCSPPHRAPADTCEFQYFAQYRLSISLSTADCLVILLR